MPILFTVVAPPKSNIFSLTAEGLAGLMKSQSGFFSFDETLGGERRIWTGRVFGRGVCQGSKGTGR
jgi:hypothetical protein